jgi:hypothetical protein
MLVRSNPIVDGPILGERRQGKDDMTMSLTMALALPGRAHPVKVVLNERGTAKGWARRWG